ncbi:unnamed protein product [Allacma fusca]|uniref:CWH43-like N-terminal domain-containing protein n=1 Tax=Allacma fusca TaxID=39272 RepID=A0A8J2NZA5_9HEXA|nr:unnamed protein product [Allacma fusca]
MDVKFRVDLSGVPTLRGLSFTSAFIKYSSLSYYQSHTHTPLRFLFGKSGGSNVVNYEVTLCLQKMYTLVLRIGSVIYHKYGRIRSKSTRMSYKLAKQLSIQDLPAETGTILPKHGGIRLELQIRNNWLILTKVALPLFGFFFSIFWAILQEPTRLVECSAENQVALNILPTVSQATGNLYLSNIVWNVCITISTILNVFYAFLELSKLNFLVNKKYQALVMLVLVFRVTWAGGVIGLSYVTSTDNLLVHSMFLGLFLVFSNLFMILNCYLLYKCRVIPCGSEEEELSQKWKFRLMILSLIVTPMLPYFYMRHMTSCEDFVYSVFAFLEYVIVLCTLGYTSLALYDYNDMVFEFALASKTG